MCFRKQKMKRGRGRGRDKGRGGRGRKVKIGKGRGRGRPRKRKASVTEPEEASAAPTATRKRQNVTLPWPIIKPAIYELRNEVAPARRFKPFKFTDARKHDAKHLFATLRRHFFEFSTNFWPIEKSSRI